MISLHPMPPETFPPYREALARAYAADNVQARRWPEAGAVERARVELEGHLPQGVETPGHYVCEIRHQSFPEAVGVLWFAVLAKPGAAPSAYVFDVEIRPPHRRQGFARAAFYALEEKVRELGAETVGLHVFAHNPEARALYASLGYGVTGYSMVKSLQPPG